ncbi:hypothetical protein [Aneurinibacillus tyrosinisolvens]|uniref:hypothetical protein n=1 Tax=Aneurinibacillus tyrosinisolvens TaxID=1443435 RepID=UPI00063F06A4|nr:hypothetical protein [Aneurinibacillus tyrosinisolvens]
MELAQCILDVHARSADESTAFPASPVLFKNGYVYPVFKDEADNWLTTDEEGFQHIIASDVDTITDDGWFVVHFRLL